MEATQELKPFERKANPTGRHPNKGLSTPHPETGNYSKKKRRG